MDGKRKTVTTHTLVYNEDRWIYFSLLSVIDYVDRMIIYDTGSTDKTADIIRYVMNLKSEYAQKIYFEEKGRADRARLGLLRQEMVEKTDTDYFMVLDGDEIYWKKTIEEMLSIINESEDVMIVATPFINCARDVRHYRNARRDAYPVLGLNSAVAVRMYSMSIPGIHSAGIYGVEGFRDKDGRILSKYYKTVLQNEKYFHTSYIQRSSRQYADLKAYSRISKLVPAYDYKFPADYQYPEVFYVSRPDFVLPPFYKESALRRFIYFLLDDLMIRKFINIFRKNKYVEQTEKNV